MWKSLISSKMMAQFVGKNTTVRVPFDEEGNNGLIINDKYIPEELLAEIFCYVDYKTLLNCQLVCKRWKFFIQNYVWRRRAEMIIGKRLPLNNNTAWQDYYLICKKKPFNKNLIKNHSGEHGLHKHWKILTEGGNCWKVESPPVGVPPLPQNEPVFEGKQSCFVSSYSNCSMQQVIDLVEEGFGPYILDNLQPPIVVSQWYSCRWDCPANYEFAVVLLLEGDKFLDSFHFYDSLEGDKQHQWLFVSHEFKNYGPGLRKISFLHGGVDKLFWAGHYGSKMAGACVCVKCPEIQQDNSEEPDLP